MTPEDYASVIVCKLEAERAIRERDGSHREREIFATVVRLAAREEREACAALAEGMAPADPTDSRFAGADEACRRVAAAIRGRP